MSLKLPGTPGPDNIAAQLYTLSSSPNASQLGNTISEESPDQIIINFPNLPDEIPLDRESEWRTTPSQTDSICTITPIR
jgi:hypothetical protein